jgi:hypothetical protein
MEIPIIQVGQKLLSFIMQMRAGTTKRRSIAASIGNIRELPCNRVALPAVQRKTLHFMDGASLYLRK